MDIKKYLLDEMRDRMATRERSYEREGLNDEKLDDVRLKLEKEDVERGLKVFELYRARIKARDWYPGDRTIEGTDFEHRITKLFTYSRYFTLQFESMFIMNYDEGGYYELTENDESYWADDVIKQLESVFDFVRFVADNYSK